MLWLNSKAAMFNQEREFEIPMKWITSSGVLWITRLFCDLSAILLDLLQRKCQGRIVTFVFWRLFFVYVLLLYPLGEPWRTILVASLVMHLLIFIDQWPLSSMYAGGGKQVKTVTQGEIQMGDKKAWKNNFNENSNEKKASVVGGKKKKRSGFGSKCSGSDMTNASWGRSKHSITSC